MVTFKSNFIDVEYNNGEKRSFSNSDYSLNLKVAE